MSSAPLRSSSLLLAVVVLALSAGQASAQAAGSAQRGATLFKQRCATCHGIAGTKSAMGPDLTGVIGRKAGAAPGYKFSKALQQSGVTWTRASLDPFLAAPGKSVKGTRMMSMVSSPTDRADIIAYLASVR